MSIERFYGDWRRYNDLAVRAFANMSDSELALRGAPGGALPDAHWPIWAIAGHAAGTRVYWMCTVMSEPGAETTPFVDANAGWEDDLDHPRSGPELASAWGTTWAIIEHVLETWTPQMLDDVVLRPSRNGVARFTRRSLLLRLITHEAYHLGEIALIQGLHGRAAIDLWPPDWHTIDAVNRGGG